MGLQDSGVPFDVSVQAEDGAAVVVVRGEFDMCEAPALRACLDDVIASSDGAVVVDLAHVTFIDSTAICALLVARRCLAGQGRELCLRRVTAPVARVFELAGLTDFLPDPAITSD
jgi:anti-anti-sigma factor